MLNTELINNNEKTFNHIAFCACFCVWENCGEGDDWRGGAASGGI